NSIATAMVMILKERCEHLISTSSLLHVWLADETLEITIERETETHQLWSNLIAPTFFLAEPRDDWCEICNKLFKEQEYHDAVRHHTEAIQRNPKEPTTRPRGMQDQGIKNILTDL
ncbi:hypothetical protein HID58_037437, partial [Brassica napus]